MKKRIVYQQGYIFRSLIIFVVIIFIGLTFLFPSQFKKGIGQAPSECSVGEKPTAEEQAQHKTLPAIKNKTEQNASLQSQDAGFDTTKNAEYVLIRKNVPVTIHPIFNQVPPNEYQHTIPYDKSPYPGFKIFYPSKWGEVDFHREFDNTPYDNGHPEALYPDPATGLDPLRGKKDQFFFRQAGIIYFVHADDKGEPLKEKIKDDWYFTVDFYQDTESFENPKNDYKTDEIFMCSMPLVQTVKPTLSIISPKPYRDSIDKKQLQLNWFVVDTDSPGQVWRTHCKPAIYLYPETTEKINVKITIPYGSLIYTDPVYPASGWNVYAQPNGELTYLSKNLADSKGVINYKDNVFPYLYYEARIADSAIEKPTAGFVKPYDTLDSFYDEILPKLGLNDTETKEFKTYWEKALPKAAYYFIGIVAQSNLNSIEPLTITPKQDTTIRVSLYFEKLDAFKLIPTPTITTPKRSGFTVVEWGGMVKQDQNHPFTCSQ